MARPKGSQNKLTADLKAMIEGALHDVGGRKYLTEQAEKNPQAFLSLLGRCLPRDLNANVQGNITLQVVTGVPPSG